MDSDSPAVRRLQFWSDQLYDRLSAEHAVLRGVLIDPAIVPRPRLRIKISGEVNGYVTGASVCRSVPIRLTQQPQRSVGDGQLPDVILSIDGRGRIGVEPSAKVICLDRRSEPTDAAAVAKYLVADQRLKNCQVSSDAGTLLLGQGCSLPVGKEVSGARGLVVQSSGIWVTLTTGLLTSVSGEDGALTALTHELGHYYRAHGARNHRDYQFFYKDDDSSRQLDVPRADASLTALGDALLHLPKVRVQPIDGQLFSSWLYSYMPYSSSKLVRPACADRAASCHDACAPWLAFFADDGSKQLLGSFPQAQLHGASLAAYWRYEQLTKACFAAIAVTRGGAAGFGQATLADVKKVFWKGAPPTDPELTLLSAVEAMNAALVAEDVAAGKLLQRALDTQLGYYTMEQEADDIGLVWLAKLGVPPATATAYWFDYAKQTAAKHLASRYDLAPAVCERLYRSQPRWTDGGLGVRVPIGFFGDVHHSPCYRIYNIDQRLQNHPTPLAADLHAAATLFGGTWEDAVSQSVGP